MLAVQPLTKESFAPFGEVLETDGTEGAADQRRHLHALPRARGGRDPRRGCAGDRQPLPGRADGAPHPPVGDGAASAGQPGLLAALGLEWLVAVAPDENGRPGAPLVFRASAGQGVCYAPNAWHHPLLALGQVCDFLVVDRDGPGLNLEEAHYLTPHAVVAV